MRRLLRGRTWRLRSSTAAEVSMVLAVATLVVPLLLFIGASWLAYEDTQKQAEERIARTLDLLYVNVRTAFETDYLVAANVAEVVDDYTNASIRTNERQIHDRLKRLVDALPQIGDVWVLDEDGRPLVTAKVFPVPAGLGYGDRAYFATHRDGGVQRYVSESLRGRLKDVEFFQYSERRQRLDGSFNGVIAVAISPGYFLDQFAQASDAKNFTASIVRSDGEILVRYPVGGGPNRLAADSGFMRAIAERPNAGLYATDRSGFDGIGRLFMYRKLPDLPIYVAHGYATESIRDIWISRMASHLVFGIPATLALFGLAVVASRRALRQTDALDRLREEQLRRESAEESLRQS